MTENFVNEAVLAGVEAKIGAMVQAGTPDLEAIKAALTSEEREELAKDGLRVLIQLSIGDKIWGKLWDSGLGMDATRGEIREIWRSLNISDEDGEECYATFMDFINEATIESISDYPSLARFAPLFDGEPEGTLIGEAAGNKVESGDKLAMSFIEWKDIA